MSKKSHEDKVLDLPKNTTGSLSQIRGKIRQASWPDKRRKRGVSELLSERQLRSILTKHKDKFVFNEQESTWTKVI